MVRPVDKVTDVIQMEIQEMSWMTLSRLGSCSVLRRESRGSRGEDVGEISSL